MVLEGDDDAARVLAYHTRTKHAPGRYARALGYLDWATQPDPFRRFEGAPTLPLERDDALAVGPTFAQLVAGTVSPAPMDVRHVSRLLYDAFALSAWKEHGASRWSLRVNPSSGNLHPTEVYLACAPALGLSVGGGVFHYTPYLHALEQRRTLDDPTWSALAAGLPPGACLVALSSIHWREAWKYGERAFRYCQHDVGHALGALSYAAAALGWQTRVLPAVGDDALSALCALGGAVPREAEHPDVLCAVWPAATGEPTGAFVLSASVTAELAARQPLGRPNRLSTDHHDWPIIDEVAQAAHAPIGFALPHEARTPVASFPVDPAEPAGALPDSPPARQVLRTRRSAVEMDGRSGLTLDGFWSCLLSVSPAARAAPWSVWPFRSRIHNLYFIHRIQGLEPGLYLHVRGAHAEAPLLEAVSERFEAERVVSAPPGIALYRLASEDVRMLARSTSCGQDIAADGAFAVSMLAELSASVHTAGPTAYRYLHYEAGLVGHALYLEAEALGLRATGIGCFFDDLVHRLFGWQDDRFAALYHFTVGGPVEDTRLRTAPAYGHLEPSAS